MGSKPVKNSALKVSEGLYLMAPCYVDFGNSRRVD